MLSTDGYTPSFAALGRLAGQVAGLLSHAEKHSKLFCGRSVRRLGAGAAQLHSPTSASACRLENPVLARCTSSAGAAAGERRLHDDGGPRTGQGAAHCPPQGSGRHRAGQEASHGWTPNLVCVEHSFMFSCLAAGHGVCGCPDGGHGEL